MKLRFLLSSAVCLPLLALPGIFQAAAAGSMVGGMAVFHHGDSGYLGVDFENLTPQQRAKFKVPDKEGVAIAAVDHDAPAGKAGLHSNDVILKMNGKHADRAEELREALEKMSPGQTVVLDILRNGHPLQITAVLADRKVLEQQAWSQHYTVPDPKAPQSASAASTPPSATAPASEQAGFFSSMPAEIGKTFSSNGGLMSYIPGTPPYTGITFDVMNPQLARYFGLKHSTGLLVKSIDPGSPGLRAGLHAGDVICKANDEPMITRSRWNKVLRDNRHDAIKLQILRDRRPQMLLLTLAASKS